MAEKITFAAATAAGRAVVVKLEGHTPTEVADAVKRLGEWPATAVAPSQRKVAMQTTRVAAAKASRRTGALVEGIIVYKKERSRAKGKAVYDVMMDPAKNAVFQKRYGGKFARTKTGNSGYAFYPASMEYGFTRTTASGSSYTFDGLYYMRSAAEALSVYHEQITMDYLFRSAERKWLKKSGGST